MLKIGSVVLGVSDVRRATAFWMEALGYVPRDEPEDDWVVLVPAQGTGPQLALGLNGGQARRLGRLRRQAQRDREPAGRKTEQDHHAGTPSQSRRPADGLNPSRKATPTRAAMATRLVSTLATTCPVSTAPRETSMTLNRLMMPLVMSEFTAVAVAPSP